MADPLDLFAIDKVIETAECSIEPVVSSENSILKKIHDLYKEDTIVGEIFTENGTDYDWRDELHNDDLSDNHIQKIIRAKADNQGIKKDYQSNFKTGNIRRSSRGNFSERR